MNPNARRWINNVEVRPGARISYGPPREPRLRFTITTVCDSASPDRWHGEVAYGPNIVITTPQGSSHDAAGQAAQSAFDAAIERAVLSLFATE